MTGPTVSPPAGDPVALRSAAAQFGNLAAAHADQLRSFQSQVKTALDGWSSPVAQQYSVAADKAGRRFTAVCTALKAAQSALNAYAGALEGAQRTVASVNRQLSQLTREPASKPRPGSLGTLSQQGNDTLSALNQAARTCAAALDQARSALGTACPETLTAQQLLSAVKAAQARIKNPGQLTALAQSVALAWQAGVPMLPDGPYTVAGQEQQLAEFAPLLAYARFPQSALEQLATDAVNVRLATGKQPPGAGQIFMALAGERALSLADTLNGCQQALAQAAQVARRNGLPVGADLQPVDARPGASAAERQAAIAYRQFWLQCTQTAGEARWLAQVRISQLHAVIAPASPITVPQPRTPRDDLTLGDFARSFIVLPALYRQLLQEETPKLDAKVVNLKSQRDELMRQERAAKKAGDGPRSEELRAARQQLENDMRAPRQQLKQIR